MQAARAAKLYSPGMLALAVGLGQFPLHQSLPLQAKARSRTCGSAITLGVALDADMRIIQIGMQVSACAVGQASAMLLAQNAQGVAPGDIIAITAAIELWLDGVGALPGWPGFSVLAPALPYPGRHGAVLLPWTAACMALSSGAACG